MAAFVRDFHQDESGQDLIEYSLLITFIAIACAAFLGVGRPATNTIWQTGNNQLANARVFASS